MSDEERYRKALEKIEQFFDEATDRGVELDHSETLMYTYVRRVLDGG